MAVIDDLVSYWSLDEASGNALDAHGTNELTDTNTVGAATGKVGGARDFTPANSEYFTRASNASLQTGDIDFSFAGWVRFDSVNEWPVVIGKDDSTTREYFLARHNTLGVFYAQVFINSTTASYVEWGSAANTATWYFVAFGHNATANDAWISVNAGTPVTQAWTSGVLATAAVFRIGARGDATNFIDGLIDEVGFWKRDIRSDLSWLYNAGNGRSYADIVAEAGPPPASTGANFPRWRSVRR